MLSNKLPSVRQESSPRTTHPKIEIPNNNMMTKNIASERKESNHNPHLKSITVTH